MCWRLASALQKRLHHLQSLLQPPASAVARPASAAEQLTTTMAADVSAQTASPTSCALTLQTRNRTRSNSHSQASVTAILSAFISACAAMLACATSSRTTARSRTSAPAVMFRLDLSFPSMHGTWTHRFQPALPFYLTCLPATRQSSILCTGLAALSNPRPPGSKSSLIFFTRSNT